MDEQQFTKTKEDLIDDLWMDWNWILNNFLDDFKDLAIKKLSKLPKEKLKEIIKTKNYYWQ